MRVHLVPAGSHTPSEGGRGRPRRGEQLFSTGAQEARQSFVSQIPTPTLQAHSSSNGNKEKRELGRKVEEKFRIQNSAIATQTLEIIVGCTQSEKSICNNPVLILKVVSSGVPGWLSGEGM